MKSKKIILVTVIIAIIIPCTAIIIFSGLEACGWIETRFSKVQSCLTTINLPLVLPISFSPDGNLLATFTMDTLTTPENVWLWHIPDGTLFRKWQLDSGFGRGVHFTPDSEQLIFMSNSDSSIHYWHIYDEALSQTLIAQAEYSKTVLLNKEHDEWFTQSGTAGVDKITVTEDGEILAGVQSTIIFLWRSKDMRLLNTLALRSDEIVWNPGQERIIQTDFSPDGELIVAGLDDGSLRIWRVTDGQLLHTLSAHASTVDEIAFSPDGAILASGSWDKTIKLWRISDGTLLRTLDGHTDSIYALTFSPDGQFLVSGSADGTVRLWRVNDGVLLRTLNHGKWRLDWVMSVDISPDGKILATSSRYGPVRLFDFQKLVETHPD